jgi:hypothetical protein
MLKWAATFCGVEIGRQKMTASSLRGTRKRALAKNGKRLLKFFLNQILRVASPFSSSHIVYGLQ